MKKTIAALLLCLMMLVSAALAENLSALSDAELLALYQDVLAEMAVRGIGDASDGSDREAAEKSAMIQRLVNFFQYWNSNSLDDMLSLCASDWKADREQPRTELFVILANRKPLSMTPERVYGTADDAARTVTLRATIDRNNGKSAEEYRFNIVMKKETDGRWYIDPSGLTGYESAEQEPLPAATQEPAGKLVLYYVPEGGSKYHVDQNCKTVHPKYLPMQGQFTMDQLNEEPFSALEPCNVCGAPVRPE